MDWLRKRTWAEVSLSAVEGNMREIRRVLPASCRFLGVVKANAYGHGAVKVARRLEEAGADYLAVACLEEGIELREAGVRLPILVLGATDACWTQELLRWDLTQEVECLEKARELSRAVEPGRRLKIHIKLDTGMGRLGFRAGEAAGLAAAAEALRLPGLEAEGCFTHFSVSDEPKEGEAYTREQFARFCRGTEALEQAAGRPFALRHCGNSGCVLHYREYALDMVRPGLLTYGMYPDREREGLTLRPAMSLKSRVAAITRHRKGESISYGRTWRAERDCTLAVLPIGYADGLHRCLSGRLEVLLRGRRVRQVGRICMDMCMLDVTDLPEAAVGDVATVFGGEKGTDIPVEELAEKAGTISYEITCAVSPRVPRVYVD